MRPKRSTAGNRLKEILDLDCDDQDNKRDDDEDFFVKDDQVDEIESDIEQDAQAEEEHEKMIEYEAINQENILEREEKWSSKLERRSKLSKIVEFTKKGLERQRKSKMAKDIVNESRSDKKPQKAEKSQRQKLLEAIVTERKNIESLGKYLEWEKEKTRQIKKEFKKNRSRKIDGIYIQWTSRREVVIPPLKPWAPIEIVPPQAPSNFSINIPKFHAIFAKKYLPEELETRNYLTLHSDDSSLEYDWKSVLNKTIY